MECLKLVVFTQKKENTNTGSGNKSQKSSLGAPKLRATSAKSKGRGAGNKSTNKSQPKPGASTSTSRSNKENVNPAQGNVELAPLEEDFIDAESLSGVYLNRSLMLKILTCHLKRMRMTLYGSVIS